MEMSTMTDVQFLYGELLAHWLGNSPTMTVTEAEDELAAAVSEFESIRGLTPTAPPYAAALSPYGLATVPESSVLT